MQHTTPLSLPEGQAMWDGVKTLFNFVLDFFSWLFAEDRVFWVGRSGAQQSSKVTFTKQPPTLTGKFPFVCCSYAWPPRKRAGLLHLLQNPALHLSGLGRT